MNLFKDMYQIIFSIQKILNIVYAFIRLGETKKALNVLNLLQTHIDGLKVNLPGNDTEVPKNFFKRLVWAFKMAKTFKEDWTHNIALITSKLQTLGEMHVPETPSINIVGESLDLAMNINMDGETQVSTEAIINIRPGASLTTTLRGPCVIKQEPEVIEKPVAKKRRMSSND